MKKEPMICQKFEYLPTEPVLVSPSKRCLYVYDDKTASLQLTPAFLHDCEENREAYRELNQILAKSTAPDLKERELKIQLQKKKVG